MANLMTPTVLQDAIIIIQEHSAKEMGQKELRLDRRMFPVLDFIMRNREGLISTDLVRMKKQSTEQPVWIDVFKKEGLGNGTVRKLKGAGRSATHKFKLNFTGISEEFDMSYLQFKNNRLTKEQYVALKLVQRFKSLYTRLEQKIIAYLETVKSPGNKGTIYPMQAGNAKYISWADRKQIFNGIKTEFTQNDFYDTVQIIGNTTLQYEFNQILAQGTSNDVNLAWQMTGLDINLSNWLTPSTNSFGTMYAMEQGTISMIDWNNGLAPDTAGVYLFDNITDPLFGLRLEYVSYKDGIDSSSENGTGYEADIVEGFHMYMDYAFAHAYSSDPNDSYVYKYELLKDGQNAPASTTAAPTTTVA